MKTSKFLIVILLSVLLSACSLLKKEKETKVSDADNDIKKKELELKEKELQLKEKELESRSNQNTQNSQTQKTQETQQNTETRQAPQEQYDPPPNNPPPNNPPPKKYKSYSSNTGSYPQASQRYLNYNDCAYLSKRQLSIMRNEIYARHGYIFQKNRDMWDHFNSQSWYSPQYYNVDNMLSKVEKYNIAFIKQFE